jgi:hypothetical protein
LPATPPTRMPKADSPASIRIDRPRLSDDAGRPLRQVGGRLWRSIDPAIPEERRHRLVADLMDARRGVKDAKRGKGDVNAERAHVNVAKVALGERGPVWWNDGAPDLNRHIAKNTPYAEWAAVLNKSKSEA